MSVSGFPLPLMVEVGASRRLAAGLGLVHAGAALIAAVMPLGAVPFAGLIRLLTVTAVALAWAAAYRRHVLRRDGAVTGFVFRPDGRIDLRSDRREVAATGARVSLIQPWLTVIVFRTADGRSHPVLLLPDNCDATVFRRLRARLRVTA